MPLEGVGIYIYTDEKLQDLIWFEKTNAAGQITFSDTSSKSYVAVLQNVPAGYVVEEYYAITGAVTEIRLAMEMVTDDALEGITMNLGDAMFDFTVTAPDGTEYKLSELLAEKEAVVLNFWYVECAPCKTEFPYLQEAYEKYSDQIALIAMNPVNADDEAIAAFQKEMELTFPMVQCSNAWESAMQLTGYPTTVVIDRYGMVSLMHMGSVTDAQTFEDIFAFFTADDYEHTVVENVEDIESEGEEGDFENPTEVGGVTSFQVQVEPGEVVYVDVYKLTVPLYLQIADGDAYVIYNDKTYSPSNGRVGLTISSSDVSTPARVGFGNSGTETKIFTINFSMSRGTMGNPYSMSLGEFTTKIGAGNAQGVYYTYKATESGMLTVQCISATAGVPYDFSLYNLNTYALRSMSGDGGQDDSGYPTVSIKVNAGNTVQFIASTLPDSSGVYPSGTLVFNAFMGEADDSEEEEEVQKIAYSVTVTDENRAPISGAVVYLDVDGTSTPVTTNASGVAATMLPVGTYDATLKLPSGYAAKTTEFKLTEKIPSISVKLDKVVVETVTYTVNVVNASGSPISGALVVIDNYAGYTDASGAVSLTMEKGDYTAYITASGYQDGSFTFAEGTTSMIATMTEGSSSASGIDYTVNIVDYFGNPVTGVTATFLKNGTYAGMKTVDSNGVATQKLEQGDYTVTLAFTSPYYYDESTAVLTADQTSVTIRVAPACGTEGEELYVGGSSVGMAYFVYPGATYLPGMQSNLVNYYLFEPTVSGNYQITTADPAAQVSDWASATFPNQVGSNYENNAYTVNVKESMLGVTYVIGVTGASDGVLLVTRIGDAVLDETDIVADVYEGDGAPNAAYVVRDSAGKTLTYFDLTAGSNAYSLVLDSATGFYHLGSVSGPIVYVNLGTTAPYVQMSNMLGVTSQYGTSFTKTFYENGTAVSKEDYTQLMTSYCECMDAENGLYPLTEDLMYMLQQGGDHKGWWDSTNPNYLFAEVSGLNPDLAWMFACCYFK